MYAQIERRVEAMKAELQMLESQKKQSTALAAEFAYPVLPAFPSVDMRARDRHGSRPYWRNERALFPQRHETMFMDVVHSNDTLRGHQMNYRDSDPSLTTCDIPGAQPCLAHHSTYGPLSKP